MATKKYLRHGREHYIDGPMKLFLPDDPAFLDETLNETNIQNDFGAVSFDEDDSRNSSSFSESDSRN